jgi:hypothetical protein
MLRISVHDEGEFTTFQVEGKLTAPSSIELENCFRQAVTARPSRGYIVKLAAVTFIDSESKELLTRLREEGVKLAPTGCFMKAIVERIEAQVTKRQLSSRAHI